MPIISNEFSGADGYQVGYIGTQVSKDAMARWQKGDCPLAALKGDLVVESNPTVPVDVQPGVPFLYGFVSTTTGTFPTGTQVTVTDPNGNTLQPGDAPGSVVYFNGNSVQSFVISNPTPGTWTLTADIPTADDSDVFVFMSTIPTGNQVHQTMIAAIEQQLDPDAIRAASDTDDSLACWACTIAAWGLIIVIAAVVAVGIFAITAPENLPAITALAAYLGYAVVTTQGILIAAITAVGTAVSVLVACVCNWINACENDLTVSIGTPTDKSTQSGTFKIAANTSGADSVSFTLDNSVLQNVTAGPPFKYFCDSTQFPNGTHTIFALAISGEETALSAPVRVTFSN